MCAVFICRKKKRNQKHFSVHRFWCEIEKWNHFEIQTIRKRWKKTNVRLNQHIFYKLSVILINIYLVWDLRDSVNIYNINIYRFLLNKNFHIDVQIKFTCENCKFWGRARRISAIYYFLSASFVICETKNKNNTKKVNNDDNHVWCELRLVVRRIFRHSRFHSHSNQ